MLNQKKIIKVRIEELYLPTLFQENRENTIQLTFRPFDRWRYKKL